MKGGGSVAAPYDEMLKSVQLADPSLARKRLSYAVDTSTGTLTYATPPLLETGQGRFPYSLPFQYFFKSGVWPTRSGYWLQEPQFGIYIWNDDPLNAGSDATRHNYEIEARIANDGFQAMGADSALDASGTIAALYALRTLTIGTQTLKTRVASVFVMD